MKIWPKDLMKSFTIDKMKIITKHKQKSLALFIFIKIQIKTSVRVITVPILFSKIKYTYKINTIRCGTIGFLGIASENATLYSYFVK